MISKAREEEGWTYDPGPNGQDGAVHKSGWMVKAAGANSPYLIWSPQIWGPDETSTCKYRKSWQFNASSPSLFGSIEAAIEHWAQRRLIDTLPLPPS